MGTGLSEYRVHSAGIEQFISNVTASEQVIDQFLKAFSQRIPLMSIILSHVPDASCGKDKEQQASTILLEALDVVLIRHVLWQMRYTKHLA